MKTKTLPLLALIIAGASLAVGPNALAASTNTVPASESEEVAYQPFETKLEIGPTTGVGISEGWRFVDHLGVRGGFDFFDTGHSGKIEGVDYHANLRFMSEPITLDWYPSATSSFHVSLGVVLNQNRLQGSAVGSSSTTFTLNGQTFNGAQVGTLNLEIKQQPVNPYVSVGSMFCYFDHARHWGFGWEAGVMYTGNARVSLTRTGGSGGSQAAVDSAVAGERNKVQSYANRVKFWPVFKLGVSYAF